MHVAASTDFTSVAPAPWPPAAEESWLAPYALPSQASAGRKFPEPAETASSCFRTDCERIIRSAAFRRLSAKTQVFMGESGDYHRTRLTHTMEVVSIARRLGTALRLNDHLIEALALAHDLGHPPFGHSGEETLNDCLAGVGGFCHNRHGLRLLEELETLGPEFPGLNLSLEVLSGQAARADKTCGPRTGLLLEVQVVEAADGITYNTHDLDDALELGLFTVDELHRVTLWEQARRRVVCRFAALAGRPLRAAVLQEMLSRQFVDVLANSQRRLREQGVDSLSAVRQARATLIAASPEGAALKQELQAFLTERVYRHPEVLRRRGKFQRQVAELFAALAAEPARLPEGYRSRLAQDGVLRTAGDYLAGMTDRFALAQHARWCGAA